MEPNFWHSKWAKGEIGFHEGTPNTLLIEHFAALSLPKGSRVFVPLCGKTRDIAWLLANGYQVVGVELSRLAIDELFDELGIAPTVAPIDKLARYQGKSIDIYVGDIFDLTRDMLGSVDAIYDRAALVALPEELRSRYAAHLITVTGAAPQLLISFDYDQQLMAGPPFAVSKEAVHRYYASQYQITPLLTRDVTGGLKGKVAATETIWLLQAVG